MVDLARRVADALTARATAAAPVVVAVDGRSGAGKSTLAALLAAEVTGGHGIRVASVALEDLYPGWTGLAAGTRMWAGSVLPCLARGRPATYQPWDWHAGRVGRVVTVPAAPVVIGEGVGAGVRQARARLDLLVWVHAAGPLRRERALARDGDVFAAWWDAWAAQEDGLLAADPIPRHAHVVVDASAADAGGWSVLAPAYAAEDDRP